MLIKIDNRETLLYEKCNNMIEHFHKNNMFNLVQLCYDCHLKVHHGDLRINGYENTSDGVQIKYEFEESFGEFVAKLNSKSIAKYNINGYVTEYAKYKSDGSLIEKRINKYDQNNNMIEDSEYKAEVSTKNWE